MINRLFIMFLLVVSTYKSALACDACGSTVSGIGIGLATDYRVNYVRWGMYSTQFSSSQEHGYHTSNDHLRLYYCSVRYALPSASRWAVEADLYYGHNKRQDKSTSTLLHGLADARFMLNYQVYKNTPENGSYNFLVTTGLGASLPTGKYNAQILDDNLPHNFNLGRGGFGLLSKVTASAYTEDHGLVLNISTQHMGASRSGYQFGDQYASQLTYFRSFSSNAITLIPGAGISYEYIDRDRDDMDLSVPETGGEGVSLSGNISIAYKKVRADISYALPITQNYAGGVSVMDSKMALQFSCLF